VHALKGVKQSPEHIANRIASRRARGGFGKASHLAGMHTGVPLSEKHKSKISQACKGQKNSLGCVRSEEFRRKLSEYWTLNVTRHNHYVDGLGHERSSERIKDMGRIDYRLWRERVFARDEYKCVLCGAGGRLHADHIKPYSTHVELRYDVDNGRTLCIPCHVKTPTYGNKATRTKEVAL
jgi:5-methylcytosine-specific restriction endonuclease McrA